MAARYWETSVPAASLSFKAPFWKRHLCAAQALATYKAWTSSKSGLPLCRLPQRVAVTVRGSASKQSLVYVKKDLHVATRPAEDLIGIVALPPLTARLLGHCSTY